MVEWNSGMTFFIVGGGGGAISTGKQPIHMVVGEDESLCQC